VDTKRKDTTETTFDFIVPKDVDQKQYSGKICPDCLNVMHATKIHWTCPTCNKRIVLRPKFKPVPSEFDCPKCGADKTLVRSRGRDIFCTVCKKFTSKLSLTR